ncbi:PH domain-containing protein [Gordonia iterans]
MSDAAADSTPADDRESVTFGISRLAYLTVLSTILAVLVMMAVTPWFGLLFLALIPQVWWIRRVRTVADADGLTAVRAFGEERVTWDRVDGLAFPRWRAVRAVLTDGAALTLPAVAFDDLPALSAVSGGRVPDPFAAEREARLAAQD